MPTTRNALLALGLVLLVPACGSNDASPAVSSEATDRHNDADIAFARDMIPHHEQAVDMSELALDRASSTEVKDLATQIRDAQDPEIRTMRGWLADWGVEAGSGGGHGGGHGGGMDGGGPGMMSESDMAELADASGAAFDRMWVRMMIEHHRGAVEMAERVIDAGSSAEVERLARDVVRVQTAEIAELERLSQALA
jgi:uncharacterized protein (DUF305 family)